MLNDLLLGSDTEDASAMLSEEMLMKSLSAGYGTDSAQFTGGRALIPEDIETTMINAMREQREDCKLMNTVKKAPVRSTVHEYNRRTDVGDHEFRAVSEGELPNEGFQSIERVTRKVKYLQEYREVTKQMTVVDAFEDPWESEKVAGTLNILRAAELLCFHGDEEVIPAQFDGLLKQIRKVPAARRNIKDYRGKSIVTAGKSAIVDTMRMIFEQGGDPNKAYFPPILAMGIQELAQESYRVQAGDKTLSPLLDSLPTPYGTLKFGDTEGPDKFFRVKGPVAAKGNVPQRPNAPQSVTATHTTVNGSLFAVADAGNYTYKVYAINQYGISQGTALAAAVPVAAGEGVTLTITPDADKPGTGFIICRSAKDGTEVMELARVGIDAENATTSFTDLNADLPGTAEMLILTEKKIQEVVNFYQLYPLGLITLPVTARLTIPMVILLWGFIELKVPEWCAIIKNIGYEGGLYNV